MTSPGTGSIDSKAHPWLALIVCLVALGPAANAHAAARRVQGNPSPPSGGSIEEVVVTGAHAGPRLWRVTRGDHVLWILGTVTPLPKKMIWQSSSVQAVLKESQEVVPGWPSFGIGWNPITMVRLYIEWLRLQKSPDHENLAKVLPPQLYARFEALKAKYAPNDQHLEEVRPMIAAERLREKTLEASGLSFHNDVQQTVLKLARAAGVKIHQDKLKVERPVDVLKDVGSASRADEISCLDAVVSRLETDLGPMRTRASAWALGDVDTLRKLPHPDESAACIAAVSTSPRVKSLVERTLDDWLMSVEDSLARNRSTLAVQTMDRLLGDNGALEALRKKGYTVDGP
jgi:uncharacterized protein YbaP (TraB family)